MSTSLFRIFTIPTAGRVRVDFYIVQVSVETIPCTFSTVSYKFGFAKATWEFSCIVMSRCGLVSMCRGVILPRVGKVTDLLL